MLNMGTEHKSRTRISAVLSRRVSFPWSILKIFRTLNLVSVLGQYTVILTG